MRFFRGFFFVLFISIMSLSLAGCFGAGKHSALKQEMKQEMKHVDALPAADSRTELKLPPQMKVKQKAMMRKHLGTIAEITEALAHDKLKEAAELASTKLGWSPEEEAKCAKVSKMVEEPDFLTLGMALHKSADEFAAFAEDGDRDNALLSLSRVINNCNACHERFRH
jgi:soluble cytochrome b562